MKIGAFAKKHKVSLDTIRHYLDIQLLLTEKVGMQYHFSEEDSKDMEEILELKRLKFSLTEVQNILSYKRLASNRTIEFRNHFRSSLERKRDEMKVQKLDIEKTIEYIEGKLYELKMEEKNKVILGVPLGMVSFFRCPHCGCGLNLSEGIIENNMIISGKIICDCKYNLIVKDGIIVDSNAIRDKTNPTKAAYYEKTSSEFINFLFKGMTNLIKIIECEVTIKKYIIEFGKCGGFFLMKYLPYLPKESTYIVVDYDLKRMNQVKNDIELNHNHNNFVFICCNYYELPLVDNFIDLFIENSTTELHAEENGMLLEKIILPLIKPGGYLASIYPYFKSVSSPVKGIHKDILKFYDKNNILNMIRSTSISDVNLKEIGPAHGAGEYDACVDRDDYYKLLYLGRKE